MIWLPLLVGCTAPGDEGPDPRLDVLASLAEHVALGHYHAFEQQAATLEAKATAVCAAVDATQLAATQAAWWDAREPWKRAEVIQFGPVVEYPERLGPKLDSWPVNAAAVEELVASTDALDFAQLGSATRGLPVVEYLLWTEAETSLASDARRCAVLSGAAADVHTNAALLTQVWESTWMPALSDPVPDEDAYDTPQAVVDEWVNRMAFTVENIRAEKLGKPAGDDSGGTPLPDTLESRTSARSLQDARDTLAGVQDVWTGDVGGDHLGVRDLLDDAELAARVDQLFDVAIERLERVPDPLEQTIVIEPEIVAYAQEALQALQVVIQVDLAQALGVTITFNDNDGD